jgi:hypothetical protein
MLMEGLDAIDLTLKLGPEIAAFQARDRVGAAVGLSWRRSMSASVLISEVGPRDGLQSIDRVMPLEAKKAWIRPRPKPESGR